jgi:hypothetical protein
VALNLQKKPQIQSLNILFLVMTPHNPVDGEWYKAEGSRLLYIVDKRLRFRSTS